MLEVHQERAAGAAHFGRKERAESEREDGPAHRSCRTKAPHAATPSHSTPPSASLGSPSMHSSNSKVRNSPSEHTQSPKSKQEAMVRSPPVMSPSSAAQMDSKLANPAKQGGSCGQSQPSPCDSKTLSGSHVPKGPQATTGSLPLKNGQGLNSAALTKGLNSATGPKGLNSGSGAKSKVKRERSTSLESFEPRDAGTPSNEPEQKDSSRVKRLCVAERRQPYSGVDWCSEGDSDEDEARYFNCNSSDVKSQGSGSLPSSNAGISRSSTPSHNVISEPAANQKPPSKIVYVFTTEMANKAAEAVLTGHADSIIAFHTRNISHSKADKHHLPLVGPLRNEPKPRQQAVTPPERNHQLGPKAPPFPPAQPPPSSQGANPALAQGSPAPLGSPRNGPPVDAPDSSGPQPGFPSEEGGTLKGGDPRMTMQQQQQLAEEIMSSMGGNPEGLSQEQLEHRERSLQTLRDIQRMLFPDERDTAPPANPAMTEGPKKPDQGPLQAMMAQSQSLGKPGPGPRPEGPPFTPPGPRDMPFSPDELGVLPPGPGMEPGDHMTPEQVAWLKLQQEFYEEKRRKQGQLQHHRPQPDFMLHQHGPRGLIRGPPPPYQMNPGEIWGPGGPEPFPEQMGMAPRGMHPPHPMQRMPGFPMMNPDLDPGPNPMSRPGLPWPDDVPKMGDGRGFPPGHGVFRGERFPNPQAVQEAMFQQGMGEKQPMGLPPGMALEMNRMMGNQRGLDPRMPVGDGPISPSRMEFVKGLGRDMGPECGAGPMSMKDMHLGVSMGPGYGKPPMSPEQMKMRQGGGPLPVSMGLQQKMLQGLPFPDQSHPGDFNMGPSRQFSGVPPGPQGPGSVRGPRGAPPFGPEQRTNMSGNGRLGHLQPLPPNQPPNAPGAGPPPVQRGQGRKPSDLNGQAGPVHPLKSPPLRQSPMLGSPSGNLKSPQTPSQLVGMLGGPPAPSVASIKSPSVMGSAGASPVHLKSPSLSAPSPGWTSSPKPPMQSPGIPQNSKPPLSMTSPNMMANMDQGGAGPPTASQSSGQPGPVNLPGSLPSGSPFNLPPEPTLSQNPLSIMMSRMSKFAMPSSTPLYHDAIKTVASSDDDSPPARSPNLPHNSTPGMGVNNHLGHPRMSGPNPALSPMGMNSMGQPMSHSIPGQVPSPNPMGPAMMPHAMMMAQDPGMMPQGRVGFPQRHQGFPPGQSPPHQVPFPHNGPGPQGGFPAGMGYPGEGGPMGRLGVGEPGSREPFSNMAGMFNDGDLHEVIRPGAAGIPEFDLSRIMPSEKPSQTLSYFPRGETPGGKPPHPLQMQGVMGMGEGGGPRMGLPMPGPGHMGPQDMPMGTQGQLGMRPPGFMPQAMMGAQHRMLSPGQHGMMGGPGMMQGKERGPMYSHQGPLGSPNMMMSLPGMGSPQQTAMMPPQMRPRGLVGDIGMGFNPGPGNPGNLMF